MTRTGLRNAQVRLALLAFIMLAACERIKSVSGMSGVQVVPSLAFDERKSELVVIHATGNDSGPLSLRTLTSPGSKVSAHYLVDRNGETYQLVDERMRAWHAGESRWMGLSDINSISIGIELVNDGRQEYPAAQIQSLLRLLNNIKRRRGLPPRNVVGHSDVAVGRKSDPGVHFPWQELAFNGFGLWCWVPSPSPSEKLDEASALQSIGYDVRRVELAASAFRMHYMADRQSAPNSAYKAMLSCISEQSRKV